MKSKVKETLSDHILDLFIIVVLVLLNIIMLYPFLYVISTSFSDPAAVIAGKVWLYPIGFDLRAYTQMVIHPLFKSSYFNTILYTIAGTIAVLLFTTISAYPLSRNKFNIRGFISKIYVVTMFFGGGMIPMYLTMKNLHLIDKRLAMVLPGVISAWNLIIMRSFFKSIPESLHESAYLDGANDWTVLWRIVVPLSKPVLSTIGLFTAVAYWNDFFSALLYLNDSKKFPLQMILRIILVSSTFSKGAEGTGITDELLRASSTQSLKSAAICITVLPIICVYPFIQKFFVKGVMIGSIKE